MTPPTIECTLPNRPCRSRAGQVHGLAPVAAGRVPRVARLLALAHRLDHLVRQGAIADYATLARLGHVSRARISQILNLLCLAPDIQEAILFLPATVRGRDPICLGQLRALTQTLDWRQQRALWSVLSDRLGHPYLASRGGPGSNGSENLAPRTGPPALMA
jgi:hypothetical protein